MKIPWVIPEQTKIKHKLLKSYMEKWMGILFNTQAKYNHPEILLYIDGFSGPGTYWTDDSRTKQCPGSPIIVANIANKYISDKPERSVIIIGIDKDNDSVEMLNYLLGKANVFKNDWFAYHAEFEDAVNSVFDTIDKKNLYRPPIFIFIDPFGYAGFSMHTITRLLGYPMVELFINLMIYEINRFCLTKEHEDRMEKLFGCQDFTKVRGIDGIEKRQLFLKNLYCTQLTRAANAQFVMPFRVNTPGQNTRPKYYLIHASNHIKALKEMKDSMFQISASDYEFVAIGINPMQKSLFTDPEEITLKEWILEFCQKEAQSSINYERIENWAYAETSGVKQTIKKALCELEQKDKVIEIMRKPKQRRNTVRPGAKIKYLS